MIDFLRVAFRRVLVCSGYVYGTAYIFLRLCLLAFFGPALGVVCVCVCTRMHRTHFEELGQILLSPPPISPGGGWA